MLYTNEVKLKPLNRIPIGHLVALVNDESAGRVGLVTRNDGEQPQIIVLQPVERLRPISRLDRFLDLGKAVVRFDPLSALRSDQAIPNGALVLVGRGFGIYMSTLSDKPPVNVSKGVKTYEEFKRQWDQPAFTSWEIGVMRRSDFILVLRSSIPLLESA